MPLVVPAMAQESGDGGAQVGSHVSSPGKSDDIIARVGDQPITLNQIDIMLNSSAMIGMTIPPPGAPERNKYRFTLLDKIISANLIYLDALDKGTDKKPVYQHDVELYTDSMLASMYRQKVLIGDIPISDEEIMAYYDKNVNKEETPFTKDVGMSIEAALRNKKFQARVADLRDRLREGIEVVIDEAQLDPAQDSSRDDAAVVAKFDQTAITWGEFRPVLAKPVEHVTVESRVAVLNDEIDHRIMLQKARAAGLENDPGFQAQLNEYKKVHLITMHRAGVDAQLEPTDDEIQSYFEQHRDGITIPEARKIQMVVMATKEDAEQLKQQIDSGEITIYEAARDYSIDPNAKKSLGEMGWVQHGTGFPELDALTFSLALNEVGGPVESPAGWHLVKVQEIRKAAFADISDADTWRKAKRMLLEERLNEYTANLRKTRYKVEVYNDVLNRLLEQETGQPAAGQAGKS
jgi:parvulin-like peptidyl-prolyl isomerase